MTCNFLAQRKTGYLVAVGEMVSGGTKIYFANTKVSDESGTIVATANSVHRYRGGSEGADGRPVIL
jgi:acyl-coenzyme A thioesterase PaaI-like protein